MATINLVCTSDARIAKSSSNMGAGGSDFMPFGLYSGFTYRTLLKFQGIPAGTTSITKAVLKVKNSTQSYVAFGSSPSGKVQRITGTWSAGSSVALSTSNAVVYPGPSATSTNEKAFSFSRTEGAWQSVDITALMRDALTSGWQGLRLVATSETSSADVGEIYAEDAGTSHRAYIELTYETNRAPNTPTLDSPANGAALPAGGITFSCTSSDPDAGNTLGKFHIQMATDAGFTQLVWDVDNVTSGISGWTAMAYHDGNGLTPGVTYYWRMAVYDNVGAKSGWSGANTFTIIAKPVVALPSGGANFVAPVWNLSDASDTLLTKPQFQFTASKAGGGTITGYEIDIDGTVTSYGGSWPSGTTITHRHPFAVSNSQPHTLRIRTRDANDWGDWVGPVTFACKYAQAIYEFNMTGRFGASVSATGLVGTTLLLYRKATGPNGQGAGPWVTSVPGGAYNYLNIMVRTYSQGTAPAQPKVGSIRIAYTDANSLPVSWFFVGASGSAGWESNRSVRRYGVRSVSYSTDVDAAIHAHFVQDVSNLAPETDYSISGWVWCENWVMDTPIDIQFEPSGGGSPIGAARVDLVEARKGWRRFSATIRTAPGQTDGRFTVVAWGGNGIPIRAGSLLHIDAVMLAEGTVAPVWTPALTGVPVVIDAQGMIIDGHAGALLRLVGSGGGDRDIVTLGQHGLVFGGDTEIWSPGGGTIQAPRFRADIIDGDRVTINGRTIEEGTYPNLLKNGGFKHSLNHWEFSQNGDNVARFEMWDPLSDWTLQDGDTYDGRGGSTARIVSSRAAGLPLAEPFIQHRFPVIAGLPYSMSALIGNHRMPSGRISLWFWDKNDVFLGGPNASIPSDPKGGQWYGGWGRVDINGYQAPDGATKGAAVIVAGSPFVPDGASTDFYLMLDQVMVTQSPVAVRYQVAPVRTDGIQRGQVSISVSAAANANTPVVFPFPYKSAPTVMVTMAGAPGGSNKLVARAINVTAQGFSLYVYTGDSTSVTVASLSVAWVAFGDLG